MASFFGEAPARGQEILDGKAHHAEEGRPNPTGFKPVRRNPAEFAADSLNAVQFAGFTLDPAGHTFVDPQGREIALRPSEFKLLLAFVAAPRRALSRDYLLEVVAGRHSDPYDRSIDVLVSRLRQKIELDVKHPRVIVTVSGIGYRFTIKPQPVRPDNDVAPRNVASVMPPTSSPQRLPAPERRQLTILRCSLGLSGSALRSVRSDPEDWQLLLMSFHVHCSEIIQRAGGTVSKQLGEAVLAYFGYPEIQEDAAERAVQAALCLVEATGRTEPEHFDASRVQIGMATGLVLVGDMLGAGEPVVLGDAPDLAARLAAAAGPGTLLIDSMTRRLVGELFQCREQAPISFNGAADMLPVWQVVGVGLKNRFEALRGRAIADLVGREEELILVLRRWEQAKANIGRVVLITGEAGIGKSRLVRAVRERLEGEAVLQVRYFCSPHHCDRPLHPVIVELETKAGIAHDDASGVKSAKLQSLLTQWNISDEKIDLLAKLLSVPAGAQYRLPEMDPRTLKERTREALLDLFRNSVAGGPSLVIFEDVHWIDPSTLELLVRIIERVAAMRVLLLITARAEFKPSWPDQAHVNTLPLNRLSDDHAVMLAQQVAGEEPFPAAVLKKIVRHAEGVPLFVEELTKAAVEAGAPEKDGPDRRAIPQLALKVPVTLQASLLARLDRLGPAAKEMAQIGAAIGREFSYELLAAVVERSVEELQAALGRLTAAGLVFQNGMPPEATYLFKHALVQDAAYSTLLRSQRRLLHARIAKTLEAQFPEIVAVQPEWVAQHCAEAGLIEKAIGYWIIAGQEMVARSAMQEALSQLSKSLEILTYLPEGKLRSEYEINLRVALGRTLMATHGWAVPVTGKNYARARQLCEELNQSQHLAAVLVGQWSYDFGRGELGVALERAEALCQHGTTHNNVAPSLLGRHCAGLTHFYLGNFGQARAELEHSLLLFDAARRRDFHALTTADPHVMTLLYLSRTLACLGYLSQAHIHRQAALNEARQLAHSFTLAFALGMACLDACAEGRVETVLRWADELSALTLEHDFPFWHAMAGIHRGWGLSMRGRKAEGHALMARNLATFRGMGGIVHLPILLTSLAEISGRAGQARAGLKQLAEAEDIMKSTQSRAGEAELYRIRGELLLAMGDHAGAEGSYRAALSVARRQSAKLWELRGATGLARLWRKQGKHSEAHDILVPTYGWFTEGFDTPVVEEARQTA